MRHPAARRDVPGSTTGSTPEPPRSIFAPVWLTAVRPQSDKTWVDLALSQSDAAELGRQLGKYDVQILKPVHPDTCAPLLNLHAGSGSGRQ
jgi:hypothetical protein